MSSILCLIAVVLLFYLGYQLVIVASVMVPAKKRAPVQRIGGDLVGYKVLMQSRKGLRSPQQQNLWKNGQLQYGGGPGIFVGKTVDSVKEYLGYPNTKMFLVGMTEPVDEYDDGYRAQGLVYIIQEA